MMRRRRLFSLVTAALLVASCEQLPGSGAGAAVVDLNAVAKATGRDEQISERLQEAQDALNTQLTEIAADLEGQLRDQQEKAGNSSNASDQEELQQMAVQAQRQLAEKRQLAQTKAQQFQAELVNEFKRQVSPVAADIARAKGATVIVVLDDSVLWYDSAADITDEVIAELRANPLPEISVSAGVESEAEAAPETEDGTGGAN